MADYTTTASFAGPPEPVLAAAIATLTNNGFAIVDRSDRGATLTGPGLNSTRQNPLLGTSQSRSRPADTRYRCRLIWVVSSPCAVS